MRLPALPFAVLATVGAVAAQAQTPPPRTGFYVGASLGNGMAKSETKTSLGGQWSVEPATLRNDVVNAWSKNLDATGFQAGVLGGYRYALPNGLVLSGEVSLDFLKSEETLATGQVPTPSVPSLSYALDAKISVKTPISVVAKVGYAIDQHLPYLTVGFAQAKVEASSQIISSGGYRKLASASESRSGFQWGLGYEYTISSAWTAFGEYTSANLGEFEVPSAYLPGSNFTSPAYTETFKHKVTLSNLRLGATYRF